jgi:hypothetical protein
MSVVARLAVGGLLLASAIFKLLDLEATTFYLGSLVPLSEAATGAVLSGLILVEAGLAGAILLWNRAPRPVYAAAFVLVVGLTLVAGWMAVLGVENCGCFGTRVRAGPGITLGKNAVLLGLIFLLWRRARGIGGSAGANAFERAVAAR